jgi:hypothetical protein
LIRVTLNAMNHSKKKRMVRQQAMIVSEVAIVRTLFQQGLVAAELFIVFS